METKEISLQRAIENLSYYTCDDLSMMWVTSFEKQMQVADELGDNAIKLRVWSNDGADDDDVTKDVIWLASLLKLRGALDLLQILHTCLNKKLLGEEQLPPVDDYFEQFGDAKTYCLERIEELDKSHAKCNQFLADMYRGFEALLPEDKVLEKAYKIELFRGLDVILKLYDDYQFHGDEGSQGE